MRRAIMMVAEVDGELKAFATSDFKPADALDVFGKVVEFTMQVGKEKVGLTTEEAEYNIYKAVDKVLKDIEDEEQRS